MVRGTVVLELVSAVTNPFNTSVNALSGSGGDPETTVPKSVMAVLPSHS